MWRGSFASIWLLLTVGGRQVVSFGGPGKLARFTLRRFSSSLDGGPTSEFRRRLRTASDGGTEVTDVSPAIEILLAEDDVSVTREDAAQLLNGVPMLFKALLSKGAQEVDATRNQEELQTEVQQLTSQLYDALAKKRILRGFRCIQPGDEPVPDKNIAASDLPTLIGLNQSALTPGSNGDIWTYAGVAVCALEIAGASLAGIDPLTTVLPATAICFAADRLFLRGALFETTYRTLFPQYRSKVIRHEAAHFLVAYLLGCPIESCILSAWDARIDPRFTGQAGTLFFDPAFSMQAAMGKIPRSTIDRYTIIVMAGIAGEALKYGKAEGGASDEAAIVELLTSTNPPWNLGRVRDQARWGVVQAALLLEEHRASYESLVATLERKGGLGECVLSLEAGLDTEELPVVKRKRRRADVEAAVALQTVAPPPTIAVPPSSPPAPDAKEDIEARLREINRKLAALDPDPEYAEDVVDASEEDI
jgi:hypothetical protein